MTTNSNDNTPETEPMTEAEQARAETETIARATLDAEPVSVDPDVADRMGAFEETALDDEEADDSRFDADPETGVVVDDADDAAHEGEDQ